ncbi:MAG: FtsX-like permease family protein [Mucinivorans sp.]
MFRNFISTLRHFKVASTLNILGLSVALAAFYIIMCQVAYDLNFDRCHSKADRIYKVEIASNENIGLGAQGVAVVSRAFTEAFGQSSPLVENYTMFEMAWGDSYLSVDDNSSRVGFMQNVISCYPSIVDVFDFDMVEGSAAALKEPGKVLMPKSLVDKFFHSTSAVGKTIYRANSDQTFSVGGVYRDFPRNTQLDNGIYRQIDKFNGTDSLGNPCWNQNNYFMYVTLTPGARPDEVIKAFNQKISLTEKMGSTDFEPHVVMTPLGDLYYAERQFAVEYLIKHGDRNATNIMLAIALLILTIAAINFVNFSTSLAPLRLKSINMQKILGSLDSTLRGRLVGEAVGMCLASFMVGMLIVKIFSQSSLSSILMSDTDFASNLLVLVSTFIIAVVMGILAGIYPAYYTTKFKPVMVISGGFALSPNGRRLRIGLIGVQFFVSMVLIIAAFFMQVQDNYLRARETGLPKENIAILKLRGALANNKTLDNELRNSPLVVDVAYSQSNIGGDNLTQGWSREVGGKEVTFDALIVSWNFPKMMGLKIADGRFFRESDTKKEGWSYIFNQTAAKEYDLEVGTKIDDGQAELVGLVHDFNFKSLQYPITPMALVMINGGMLGTCYVKITGDAHAAVEHIRRAVATIDPVFPIDVNFYDQTFNNLYKKEQKTRDQITLFSLLAIIISLVGVFGLVLFETQYRRREIGLRKINGATVGLILGMFNRKFVWIIAVCFALAAPVAYFGVNLWLEDFAYRTPLHWWVFAAALLIVLTITLLTVTVQSYRAATENPVKSIKS